MTYWRTKWGGKILTGLWSGIFKTKRKEVGSWTLCLNFSTLFSLKDLIFSFDVILHPGSRSGFKRTLCHVDPCGSGDLHITESGPTPLFQMLPPEAANYEVVLHHINTYFTDKDEEEDGRLPLTLLTFAWPSLALGGLLRLTCFRRELLSYTWPR